MRKRSEARRAEAGRQERLPVDFTAGLNPEQTEVVLHDDGPLRVLALAGSGKTESLSRRIARLVAVRGVPPERILTVTFSTKGAEEMKTRITKKFGVAGVRVGTIHSLCLQILREDGLPEARWTVQDTGPGTNPKMVLKDVLGWRGMDWKGADLSAVNSYVGVCKANLYAPESDEAAELARARFGWQAEKARVAYHRYDEAIREKALLTFDDYMVVAVRHLRENEEARAAWAARWDFGMQDEFQDANRAQKTLLELLCRDHRNYMAIGDCFQSIYGFRGSSPEFLAKFDADWPDARTIVLPRNYRSGNRIIEAANRIVARAKIDGLESPSAMVGERGTEGEVRVFCAESLDDEANGIVDAITKSAGAGDTTHADHTILFRTNAQSRALEEALLQRRVPYVVVGGVSFYERKEVRDLLAYLRLADRRGTAEDVKRSINTPFRFLGTKYVEKVMEAVEDADEEDVDWAAVVEAVSDRERIQQRQKASAHQWADLVRFMQRAIDAGAGVPADVRVPSENVADLAEEELSAGQQARRDARPAALLEHVVRVTLYIDWLNKEEGGETTENSGAANVREMVRVAERFQTTGELLDYIDETIRSARRQREDKQAGGERVLLMSVHRSKGLEWPRVYVAGMNEMILPHAKGDPEEERRLAYVAVTRARDVLVLSHVRRIATRAGVRDAAPSRFLLDAGLPLDAPPEAPPAGAPGLPAEAEVLAAEEVVS